MQEIKKINLSLDKSQNDWGWIKAKDFMLFNPKESIKKGTVVKNVPMDKIEPKTKEIPSYELTEYKGGVKFRNGDILMARITPCLENGKISQVSILDYNEIGAGSTEFIVLREKEGISDKDFIYYLSNSEYFKEPAIKSMVGSSGRQRVQRDVVENLEIYVPPLETQKKIGKVLSFFDKKISLNKKINKNLTICIDVNFKNNLLNFNQYSEQELVSSELGLIPKEWEVSNLTNIANYQNGLAMQKFPPENDADCFKVLKIKELRQGFFDETSDSCSKNIKEECIVYDGDVIFSWSGSLLVDIWTGGTCGLNQHLFKVTSSKFDKWFYYCWTKFYLDQFILIAKDKATTMGHIKRKHLDESLVLIPDKETYSKLTMLFKPLFDMLIKNKIEIKKLQNLRDVLMPKLMSGEVDVSKINCDLELKYNYMKYLFNQIHTPMSKSVV